MALAVSFTGDAIIVSIENTIYCKDSSKTKALEELPLLADTKYG
jgi:hypothetical protein